MAPAEAPPFPSLAREVVSLLFAGARPQELSMAERRASLMDPRIEQLMAKVDSKFTLVTLSSMRAREINDYYNQLGEGLGRIVPPQVTSVSRKPLSIAMEEIAAGKITFERIEPVEKGEAAAETAADLDADSGDTPA